MFDHSETDDSALLDDFRDTRNDAAFTEIVRRHLPLVFHVAFRRLGTAALAEEAAQHAFARLAAKVATVSRHPERLRAWLHRTAYFEASTLARKETRLSRLPIKPEPATPSMDRPEIYDRLDEALSKLPELDRELVLRHCCGGEDYRRMAAAVGKSEAACQKRVERALARLGQGLGGARTAGIVFAAFAASNVKSQAMPAAEHVAAAALKYQSATSGAAGAFSGMKLGACAVLVLAGGAAGWQPQEVTATPPTEVRSLAARSRAAELGMVSKKDGETLAPRPATVTRTLDDVLETIQAGRFSPLIDFLPDAKVSDLQAIIAEDDYVSGEGESGDHFGTARNLAFRRWAEIDPEGAFRFALTHENDHPGLGDLQEVFTIWCETDNNSASAAYRTLSVRNQIEIITTVDDHTAGSLATACPQVAWALQEKREDNQNLPESLPEAELLLATLLNGNAGQPPSYDNGLRISRAFEILTDHDPAYASARADLIPWPGLRAGVLASIYKNHPPKSASLSPGYLRSYYLASEMGRLMADDPEAALDKFSKTPAGSDRAAMLKAVSLSLAGSDPWRLIDLARSIDDSLSPAYESLKSALAFAGREDPQRALAALSEMTLRVHGHGRTIELVTPVVSGWLEKDPIPAIKWAGNAGITLNTEKVTGDTAAVAELLDDEIREISAMAHWILVAQLKEALAKGSSRNFLSQMSPSSADRIIGQLAFNTCWVGYNFDGSFEIAGMASPAKRREILPELAFYALRSDAPKAMAWLKSIPAEDQKVIISGIETHFVHRPEEEIEMIRQHIKQLTP